MPLPIREIQHLVRVLFPSSPHSFVTQQPRRSYFRRLRMLREIVVPKHHQRPFRLLMSAEKISLPSPNGGGTNTRMPTILRSVCKAISELSFHVMGGFR